MNKRRLVLLKLSQNILLNLVVPAYYRTKNIAIPINVNVISVNVSVILEFQCYFGCNEVGHVHSNQQYV